MSDAPQTSASRSALAALTILESFDPDNVTQSLADISRRLELPKATALRILRALESRGYVTHDRQRKLYSLGSTVLTLAENYLSGHDPLLSARQALPSLANETGETAHIGVLSGTDVVYIDIADSPQRVRAFVKRHEHLPAHCVASGKAILAHSDPSVVEAVIRAGLTRLTSRTIASKKAFLEDLRLTRERGYAVNIGEWMEDVVAVSVPLFSHQGVVAGAIGVAWPKSRLTKEKLNSVAEIVSRYAGQFSPSAQGAKQFPRETLEEAENGRRKPS